MHYIVMDLEWNQSSDAYLTAKAMPFEIIEIGAIKLNEEFQIIDEFNCFIRPKLYPKIHSKIKEIIGFDERELAGGKSFVKSSGEFLEWCGNSYCFCTWGSNDLMEFQRNLDYFSLPILKKPLKYYDLQKIYATSIKKDKQARSLETVVRELGIPIKEDFHHALADARYTAEILKRIDKRYILRQPSIDYYNNPKSKAEEIRRTYFNHYEYITREFDHKLNALADAEVKSYHCYLCKSKVLRKIRWFASSQTVYYSIMYCKKHGYLRGKIKIKTTAEGKVFVVKKISQIDEKAALSIRKRYDEVKAKKTDKQKKSHQKE